MRKVLGSIPSSSKEVSFWIVVLCDDGIFYFIFANPGGGLRVSL